MLLTSFLQLLSYIFVQNFTICGQKKANLMVYFEIYNKIKHSLQTLQAAGGGYYIPRTPPSRSRTPRMTSPTKKTRHKSYSNPPESRDPGSISSSSHVVSNQRPMYKCEKKTKYPTAAPSEEKKVVRQNPPNHHPPAPPSSQSAPYYPSKSPFGKGNKYFFWLVPSYEAREVHRPVFTITG